MDIHGPIGFLEVARMHILILKPGHSCRMVVVSWGKRKRDVETASSLVS